MRALSVGLQGFAARFTDRSFLFFSTVAAVELSHVMNGIQYLCESSWVCFEGKALTDGRYGFVTYFRVSPPPAPRPRIELQVVPRPDRMPTSTAEVRDRNQTITSLPPFLGPRRRLWELRARQRRW